VFLLAGFLLFCALAPAFGIDRCAVCGGDLGATSYILTDKVNGEKKPVCQSCSLLPQTCFVCGLPVKHDFTSLPDGRFLCERDAKNAILEEDQAKQVFAETQEAIDRLFARFVVFPATNVEVRIVDRVNLQELFKTPGRDHQCPNVLGYIQSSTNGVAIRHQVSLLAALPKAELKTVSAHELGHAWLFENVPASRKRTLAEEANEGFCELVAYMLMSSQQEEEQQKSIRRNAYTRGQIDLFIDAEHRFGFNEIVDWMKYGRDAILHGEDLNRIRNIEIPSAGGTNTFTPTYAAAASAATTAPKGLVLGGISWSQNRPLAVINNRTFAPKEAGKVRVGGTNLTIRCLEIRTNSVVVQTEGSSKTQELFLRDEE
jgi:hypothetical protein